VRIPTTQRLQRGRQHPKRPRDQAFAVVSQRDPASHPWNAPCISGAHQPDLPASGAKRMTHDNSNPRAPRPAVYSPRNIPTHGIREIHFAASEDDALALWRRYYACVDPACVRPDQPHNSTVLREGKALLVASVRIKPRGDQWELSVLIAPQSKGPWST
jgi:hypothetical protein